MSISPTVLDGLTPNGFLFTIQKLPDMQFFCQQVNLPGITLGDPEFANPFRTQPIPGETLTYDQLNVQFIVDVNMRNYISIYNWIIALGFPNDYTQYVSYFNNSDAQTLSELASNYSDATLQILGPNNVAVQTVHFIDCMPTSIESLSFSSTNTDLQYFTGNATFKYGYYKFL